jgi:hypothetical protein
MIEPVMMRLRQAVDKDVQVPETTLILFRFLYFLTKTRGFKTIGKTTIYIIITKTDIFL